MEFYLKINYDYYLHRRFFWQKVKMAFDIFSIALISERGFMMNAYFDEFNVGRSMKKGKNNLWKKFRDNIPNDDSFLWKRKKEVVHDLICFMKMMQLQDGEPVKLYGYSSGVDFILFQELINEVPALKNFFPAEITDLNDHLISHVNDLPDTEFDISSDYEKIIPVKSGKTYSLADKLEMFTSHPQYPQQIESVFSLDQCLWIKSLHNFLKHQAK